MIVRLGYVAMSTVVQNASPSKSMTFTQFSKIADREAAIRKLERIAADNLHNTLRLLRHNRAHDIRMYRFSSKLIPLFGHHELLDWRPIVKLTPALREIGQYVQLHDMRVSFHPDHFTVLSTNREQVLKTSIADIERHVQLLEAMGLDESAKCNIHVGGTYGDKEAAGRRFIQQFLTVPEKVRRRITLENDDKTFNTAETLAICEEVRVPMVLDIHHDQVNASANTASELWPRILNTWNSESGSPPLPPKIHASSPKNEKQSRSHADYVNPDRLISFLRSIASMTPAIDVMLEAKMKDGALFQLMEDVQSLPGIRIIDQASFEIAAP